MNIMEIQAQWVLGLLPPEKMPEIALFALEAGYDGDALRILAVLEAPDLEEAVSLFEAWLQSLDCENMPRDEAMRIYIRAISRQILENEIEPYIGARQIWNASIKIVDLKFHDADAFVYAASEYESRPDEHDFFDSEIRKEAKRWLPVAD